MDSLDCYLENMFNCQCGIYEDDWPDEYYDPANPDPDYDGTDIDPTYDRLAGKWLLAVI